MADAVAPDDKEASVELDAAVRYEFVVAEQLSPTALAAFPGLTAKHGLHGTVLYGPVRDNEHLHGLLSQLTTLRLTIVEMRQLPD